METHMCPLATRRRRSHRHRPHCGCQSWVEPRHQLHSLGQQPHFLCRRPYLLVKLSVSQFYLSTVLDPSLNLTDLENFSSSTSSLPLTDLNILSIFNSEGVANSQNIHFFFFLIFVVGYQVFVFLTFHAFLTAFRYQKNQYNVFEVNQTGYDNCTTEGAVGNWSSGKDFIPLNKAKRYYFICGNGQCFSGMKVSVIVHPLPPPPTSALAAPHSTPNSASPLLFKRSLLLSSVFACSGFVWM